MGSIFLMMPALTAGRKPGKWIIAALCLAGTLPVVSMANWPFTLPAMLLVIGGNSLLARRISNGFKANSLILILKLAIVFTVFANRYLYPDFNQLTRNLICMVGRNYATLPVPPSSLFAVLFGFILVTAAVNDPIAWILKSYNLLPDNTGSDRNTKGDEPARGKAIGYLERGIAYLLIISGNAGAIGFVLAAKTFARFKQLDQKEFAEYVLIGTLFSFFATIVVSLGIKQLL